MAYTDAEKSKMYQSVSGDLTNVAVELQNFVDSETSETEASEEVVFARSTVNQIVSLIGNFSIRAKRCEKE